MTDEGAGNRDEGRGRVQGGSSSLRRRWHSWGTGRQGCAGLIALIALAALVRGGEEGCRRYESWHAAQEISQAQANCSNAWARLWHCLLGPELTPGETAFARYRSIQLQHLADRRTGRQIDESWPRRCMPHARAMLLASRLAEPLGRTIGARLEPLVEAELELTGHHQLHLTQLREAAAELPASTAAPTGVPAPSAAEALGLGDVPPLADEVLFGVPSHNLDGGGVALLNGGLLAQTASVCQLLGAERKRVGGALCVPAPRHVEALGRGQLGARLGVFKRWGPAFALDPLRLLVDENTRDAYSRADGVVFVRTWTAGPPPHALVHVLRPSDDARQGPTGAPSVERVINLPEAWGARMLLLVDAVVFVAERDGAEQVQVVGLDALLAGDMTPTSLGEVNDGTWPLEGCGNERLRGLVVGYEEHGWTAVEQNGSWSQLRPVPPGRHLSCGAEGLTLTGLEFGDGEMPRVVRTRCTIAACNTERVSPWRQESSPPTHLGRDRDTGALGLRSWLTDFDRRPAGKLDAIDLGGTLLVAWVEADGYDVRFKIGSTEGLPAAPETVAFDSFGTGLLPGGRTALAEPVFRLQLVAAGEVAALLVGTTSGLRAVRIDAKGEYAPIAPDREPSPDLE